MATTGPPQPDALQPSAPWTFLTHNGARDERHPDSQAWPPRGDAETKGRSAAESERSEDVRSIEGLGRLRRPPLKGPSRTPLSRRRRINARPEPLPEAGARYERTLEAVRCSALLGLV